MKRVLTPLIVALFAGCNPQPVQQVDAGMADVACPDAAPCEKQAAPKTDDDSLLLFLAVGFLLSQSQ